MQNMTAIRLNALLSKSMSNPHILAYSQPCIASSICIPLRSFASKSTPKKKPTKKEEKIQKLLKQYPDPREPKRPQNAYLRFHSDYRQQDDMKLSPATLGAIAKRTSSAWANLPDHQKSQYTQQYAVENEQYKTAKERYEASNRPQEWLEKITKLAEERPPSSGYHLFVKKRTAMLKQQSNSPGAPTEILSMAANEWSALGVNTKEKWTERAKTAYAEWEAKMRNE